MKAADAQIRPAVVRAAIIIYLLIVTAGLAGTGAHALWSQTGTLASGVTAGTWAPAPVAASSVTCTRANTNNQVDVTLSWAATDASSYTVTAPGATPASLVTGTATAVLRVDRPGLFDTDTYNVTLTPEAAGVKASSTLIRVELYRGLFNSTVTCR
ncbi:hypothetical protein ACFVYC_10975 [Pseudarthrobacter sp. NPDC058329]|uniref:hypothetical protein n=1 Tax=Pseudarthrobacter sp. NPDC058329 TaxID=3346448 RepID=UPI0036D9B826